MEPHATIAEWDGDHLTLYDKSQWVDNVRSEIAHVFGMPEANIRVIWPFVGGAFGSALRTWPHVTIAALAARQRGDPFASSSPGANASSRSAFARKPCSVSHWARKRRCTDRDYAGSHRTDLGI